MDGNHMIPSLLTISVVWFKFMYVKELTTINVVNLPLKHVPSFNVWVAGVVVSNNEILN